MDFLIIGAMKCGTTSLSYYLNQISDINIPAKKDIYFFSDDTLYSKGLNWYRSHFKLDNNLIKGEGTDDYSKYWKNKKTATRIQKHFPDIKLIYICRHPLKQIESAYIHYRAASHEKQEFNDAVIHSKFNYMKTANYDYQLKVYEDLFKNDKILVLFTEDLQKNPINVLNRCIEFLGSKGNTDNVNLEIKNSARSKRYDTNLASNIRKSKVATLIAQNLPGVFKIPLKKVVTKKYSGKPTWDKEVKNRVIKELGEDSVFFLRKHGKSADFWKFK